MKKYILIIPVLLFAANILMAQDDELPPPTSKPKPTPENTETSKPDDGDFQGFKKHKKVDLSKFIIEPDFNFAISSDRIDFGVSPYVAYNVWKNLFLGGGITYFYTGFSAFQVLDSYGNLLGEAKAHYNTYGAGVLAQYNIWGGFFARAKFEVLHRDLMDNIDTYPLAVNPSNPSQGFYYPKIHTTTPDLLLGVGYNMLRSKNFFFPIILSYNVLYSITDTKYSVYPNGLVVQLGFVNVF